MKESVKVIAFITVITLLIVASPVYASDLGVVGKLVSVGRVDAEECAERKNKGLCAFTAAERAINSLNDYMTHFKCVAASGVPKISILPYYEKLTRHDPGPVMMIEARDLRCANDPRIELKLVGEKKLAEQCSKLSWKCNIVWIPDYDPTIVFLGNFSVHSGK